MNRAERRKRNNRRTEKVYKNEKLTLADFGLNPALNFLEALLCECGCGTYMNLCVEKDEGIESLCGDLVLFDECGHCAVFALRLDGSLVYSLKTRYESSEPETYIHHAEGTGGNKNIGRMVTELGLHKYGMLVEVGKDEYKVLMS